MDNINTRATTYTFSVTVTAPAADDDGNGYTQADIEHLVKRTLGYHAAPLNKERHWLEVDWELMDVARPRCGGCGVMWEDDSPAPAYCEACEDERAQDARANDAA